MGHIEPNLTIASAEEIAVGKASQADKAAVAAVLAERFANGPLDRKTLIMPYNEVPEAERNDYLWMADEEQAEAWFYYHDIERLKAEKAALQP